MIKGVCTLTQVVCIKCCYSVGLYPTVQNIQIENYTKLRRRASHVIELNVLARSHRDPAFCITQLKAKCLFSDDQQRYWQMEERGFW